MSIIKPVWVTGVVLRASAVLAALASDPKNIDLKTLGADLVDIAIKSIFGATPNNSVLIEVFGSADEGTTIDTEPLISTVIVEATSATKIISVPIEGFPFITVKPTNQDTASSVTLEMKYAWRQWNSA